MAEAGLFFCDDGLPAESVVTENVIDLESDDLDAPGNLEFDNFATDNQIQMSQESNVGSDLGSTEQDPYTTDGVNSLNSSHTGSVYDTQPLPPNNRSYPYDFDTMTPNAIYDEFHKGKSNNMGFCARFVLSKLVTEQKLGKNLIIKHINIAEDDWAFTLDKKLKRTKADIQKQKQTFLRICTSYGPQVLSYVRQLCKLYFEKKQKETQTRTLEEAREGEIQFDISESLGARLAHLVVEEDVKDLMGNIALAKSGRERIDDKELRPASLWDLIAEKFYNNNHWELQLFDEHRTGPAGVDYLDPRLPPATESFLSGSDIMHKFGTLKTMYTVVYDKYFSSGQGIGGGNPEFEDLIESESIFYENFAKYWYPRHAALLLYCLLYTSDAADE